MCIRDSSWSETGPRSQQAVTESCSQCIGDGIDNQRCFFSSVRERDPRTRHLRADSPAALCGPLRQGTPSARNPSPHHEIRIQKGR
eukprot:1487711-Pyramimonas_sp.AAC.1